VVFLSGSLFVQFYFLYELQLEIQFSRRKAGNVLTCLTPPHLSTCPKSGPGVPMSYVVVFLCSVCSLKMRDDYYVNEWQCNILFVFILWMAVLYFVCFYIMNGSVIFCLFLYYEWQCYILFVFILWMAVLYFVCFYIMNGSVIFCLFLYYEWQCNILFVFILWMAVLKNKQNITLPFII
jgi:hypothetical protein